MEIPGLKQEVNELVLDQIRLLEQSSKLNKMELFEYRLRHCRIMELYVEMDRIASDEVRLETRLTPHGDVLRGLACLGKQD
jgi:hypothetical protein